MTHILYGDNKSLIGGIMTLYWRSLLLATLIFSLVFSVHPGQYAFADTSAQWQDIKDILDLGKPVRRNETFAEGYYRLETRLSPQQKAEFGVINKRMKYQMPMYRVSNDIKITETKVTLTENGKSIVIEVKKDSEGQAQIHINDRVLSESEALSPIKALAILEDIAKKEIEKKSPKNKSAWLWTLVVPEADAGLFGMSWGTLLTGAAIVGALGFVVYKTVKKKSAAKCKNKSEVCCNVAGTLTQLSSGCCSDAGGSDTAYATCPTAMYIEGETTPSATIESITSGTTTIEANTPATTSTGVR